MRATGASDGSVGARPSARRHPGRRSLLHAATLVILGAALALIAPAIDRLNDFHRNVVLETGIYIILAVSLNLILGMAGQFSLGHAGLLGAGAYTAVILAVKPVFLFPQLTFWHVWLGLPMAPSFTLIMVTGVIAGAGAGSLVGLVVGLPTLRLRGDYLAIATLGLGEILREITINIEYFGTTRGISVKGDLRLLNHADLPPSALLTDIGEFVSQPVRFVNFFWIFLGALITLAIVRNIKYSTSGRALLALREDTTAAEAVGIPTTRYKVAAFVIGAALAGMAGGFFSYNEAIDKDTFTFTRSIMIVAMVILGGSGSVSGSVAAAVILTVIPAQLLAMNLDKSRLVIFSLVIILSMLFRPQGLFGRHEITDVGLWFWRKVTPHRRGLSPTQARGLRSLGLLAPADDEPTPGPATLSAEDDAAPAGERTGQVEKPAPLLEIRGLTMQFGGLRAVDDFALTLMPGELVGLIGPNGAGKTTVFNILTGVYRPTRGDIFAATAQGVRPVRGLKPHAIAHLGIVRTFQNIRLFSNLSVMDNVQIAQHAHHRQGIPSAILRTPAFFREEEISRRRALGYLDLFDLAHLAGEQAGSLSYGDQRRLEIARALATRPRILLLDEPAAGMNPTEKRELMELILSLRPRFGLTVLLIEHDMKVIMGVCQRILVLDYGKTIAEGTPEEIRKNPAVIQAYLGASGKQE